MIDNSVSHAQADTTSPGVSWGNGCAHRVDAPRFFERSTRQKRTYDVIHFCLANLQRYYFSPHEWLPNLTFARTSTRQQRSERREAIASVAQVLVNSVDMSSLYIASLKDGKKQPLSVVSIAKAANISQRRCERALLDLKRAGYLELLYRSRLDKTTGELRAQVAFKRFSRLFFYHLGITYNKLQRCIAFAQKQVQVVSSRIARFAQQERISEAKDTIYRLVGKKHKGPLTSNDKNTLVKTLIEQLTMKGRRRN